jgi:tetratricopeptide (TPR) repeat protein
MGLGMTSMGLKDLERAWSEFLDVLTSSPDDADAIHWLVRAGTALERWDRLAEELRRYLTRNPGDAALRFALAGILLRAGQIEAARGEFDNLRLLHPEQAGLHELEAVLNEKACVTSDRVG